MPLFSPQRRDGNERGIILALEAIGAEVEQMDKSVGCDLLVGYCGVLCLMEVKEKGNQLTDRERKLFIKFGKAKVPCFVVEDIDDAIKAVRSL